jgi:hypothetical protein
MKPDETKTSTQSERPDPKPREERGAEKKPAKIDFAKLDLTIEKVEERISPSETNVFDK